jgi:hypothetical protein
MMKTVLHGIIPTDLQRSNLNAYTEENNKRIESVQKNVETGNKASVSLVILSEFVPGNTLKDWAESQHWPDEFMWKTITFQLLCILGCLEKMFPGFRHHNFIPKNILLDSAITPIKYSTPHGVFMSTRDVMAKVGGFYFSDCNDARNRLVTNRHGGNSGVGPDTDIRYDVFTMLNSLFCMQQVPITFKKFVASVIPLDLLVPKSNVVNNFRIVETSQFDRFKFRTPVDLLGHPYFKILLWDHKSYLYEEYVHVGVQGDYNEPREEWKGWVLEEITVKIKTSPYFKVPNRLYTTESPPKTRRIEVKQCTCTKYIMCELCINNI